jgi:hypothetical protein
MQFSIGKGVAIAGMWLGWAATVVGTAVAWGPDSAGTTVGVATIGLIFVTFGTLAVAIGAKA